MNKIVGYMESREVFIDGKQLLPAESQKVYNHSPDGFNWGYYGSGPSQLALAILLEFTDKETARSLYQEFKQEIVASLSQSDFAYKIDVHKWVQQKIEKGKEARTDERSE